VSPEIGRFAPYPTKAADRSKSSGGIRMPGVASQASASGAATVSRTAPTCGEQNAQHFAAVGPDSAAAMHSESALSGGIAAGSEASPPECAAQQDRTGCRVVSAGEPIVAVETVRWIAQYAGCCVAATSSSADSAGNAQHQCGGSNSIPSRSEVVMVRIVGKCRLRYANRMALDAGSQRRHTSVLGMAWKVY